MINIFVTNFVMHGDEVSELGRDSRVWIGKRAHDVTRMVKYSMVVTLTLHDHVMHDDTTNPHVTVSSGDSSRWKKQSCTAPPPLSSCLSVSIATSLYPRTLFGDVDQSSFL